MAFIILCAWCHPQRILGLKCSGCKATSPESAKYCSACGRRFGMQGVTHGCCPVCLREAKAELAAAESLGERGSAA